MFHYQADHLRRITTRGMEVYIPCLALDNCPDNCGYMKNDVPFESVRYGALSFSDLHRARQRMGDPRATYDYLQAGLVQKTIPVLPNILQYI